MTNIAGRPVLSILLVPASRGYVGGLAVNEVDMSELGPQTLTELAVTLLTAYTQNNTVRSDDLPNLILAVHGALVTTASETSGVPAVPATVYKPAVSVDESTKSTAHIISLIDGKPYKSLKRHLTAKRISPEQYRERYNLPSDYPMVAPEYSESRRQFAKNIGLGGSRPADRKPPAAKRAKAPRAEIRPHGAAEG